MTDMYPLEGYKRLAVSMVELALNLVTGHFLGQRGWKYTSTCSPVFLLRLRRTHQHVTVLAHPSLPFGAQEAHQTSNGHTNDQVLHTFHKSRRCTSGMRHTWARREPKGVERHAGWFERIRSRLDLVDRDWFRKLQERHGNRTRRVRPTLD